MKKVWSFIILAAIIGLGMAVTGYIFGASMSIRIDMKGAHIVETDKNKREHRANETYTEENEHQEDAADTENYIALKVDSITDIDIDVLTPLVEIIPSDKYKLEINYREEAPISYTINNGRLEIEQEASMYLFNFNINLSSFEDYIKIYIPYDAVLDTVNIEISSGEVIINDSTCSILNLKLTSGKITVQDVYADKLSLVCTSGNVNFKNCEVDSFSSRITSGSFKAYELKSFSNFSLSMTSGKSVIEGELLGKNKIKLTSGEADITINGREEDYNRIIDLTSGNVYINGNKNDSDYNGKSALNDLNIEATSGNVSINFKK